MSRYKKILVPVSFADGGDQLAIAGKELAATFGAALSILHVVEYMPVEPMGESLIPTAQIENDLLDRSRTKLHELVSRLGLEDCIARVESGNLKAEILRIASEEAADLIIIGSRERHGPGILLNLTEDTVLHAAHCDVLAIRLK